MSPRSFVQVCVWHITLAACLILAAGSAAELDTSRFSKEYVERICDVEEARFIIISFTEESGLIVGEKGLCTDPYVKDVGGLNKASDLSAAADLLAWNGEKMELRRLFQRSVASIGRERKRLAMKTSGRVPNLNAYGIVRVPGDAPLTGEDLHALLERLNSDPRVAIAYPRPYYEEVSAGGSGVNWSVQQTMSDTPNFKGLQKHREGPWENGFNANVVESWAGALGENVKVIDIEGNWNWDHEDLPAPFAFVFEDLIPPDKSSNHGTASVGVIAAQDNGYGVTGFVPNAQIGGVVCPVSWDEPDNWWDASTAIDTAASLLDAGDVYFMPIAAYIELGVPPLMPIEYFPANFDAIRTASLAGIICVEPAGNNHVNLNDWLSDFEREDPDHDCLAIMVGGYDYSHGLLSSNYGVRVDVHGWWGAVVTTGYGGLYGIAQGLSEDRYYHSNYNGTSSASSVVAGAVASIQSIYKADNNGQVLSPIEMRQWIRESGHYLEGVSDVIGPRPDIAESFRYRYDTGSPEAVTDLYAGEVKSNRITLAWHAPADDYRNMYVTGYDLRYSDSPINESNFESASQVPDVMDPSMPNLLQVATVAGLNPSTMYYFAIKSSDPGGHVSPISNVVCVTTDDPAPEIVFDVSTVNFGGVRINRTRQVNMTFRNTGTADLTILGCQVYYGAGVEFACILYTTDPIPAGGSGSIQLSGTPLILAHLQGAVVIQSNDPDNPIVCLGMQIDGADLYFSDVTITTGPNGQASGIVQVENPSTIPVFFNIKPQLCCDISHGQYSSDYFNLASILNNASVPYNLQDISEISTASLESVDALYVSGSNPTWTTDECQAVAEWVQNGGGLFIDCGPTKLDVHTALNPLLEQLSLGTPLGFEFGAVPTGTTTMLSDDELLAGVNELTLVSELYKLTSVPEGADWLVKTPDGAIDKGFKATVGAGRVVVIADNIIQGSPVSENHSQFALNAFRWLMNQPSWLEFSVLSQTVEAQASFELAVEVDATGLSLGTYTYTCTTGFLSSSEDFDVTLHVINAQISDIVKEYADHDYTKIRWATNFSLPCRFRYRVLGQTTWSNPIMTAAALSHQVTFDTQPATHYEGFIEVMSGADVVADSLFHFKTQKYYPILVSTPEGTPNMTYLDPNHPNPFNPTTRIRFGLATPGTVTLRIYDASGRLIRVLEDANLGAGHYERTWDGTDLRGSEVASGVYFYRLTAPSFVETKKMVLLR